MVSIKSMSHFEKVSYTIFWWRTLQFGNSKLLWKPQLSSDHRQTCTTCWANFPYNLTHFSVRKVTGQGQGQLTNKNHIFGHISTYRQVRANPFDLCGTLKGSLTPHIRTKQITRSIKMLRPFITWQVVTAMLQNRHFQLTSVLTTTIHDCIYNKGYMIYGREKCSHWQCVVMHMDLWSSYLPA